ncbi:MAG TPA: ABC transporter permease [Terracidiphilus sp.]|nr:ABC transporter permease [Terracidiphilus sp.]
MKGLRAFSLRRRKDDLREEIESHLCMAIADRVAQGESAEAARQAAIREFGNPPLVQEVTRVTWGWLWLERFGQDLRYALRQMRRSPGFAASVIGTLALGIGAATAMFTVVDHMLLRPLLYKDANRLVAISEADRTGKGANDVPWQDIQEWRSRNHSFTAIAFTGSMNGRNYIETKNSAAEVYGVRASANLFDVLGVQPALGRGFFSDSSGADEAKNAQTIILSDAAWRGTFQTDPNILGKPIRINDTSYTVVGVMPRGFSYPKDIPQLSQVWIAAQIGNADQGRTYDALHFEAIGRLRSGVTLAAARAEMRALQQSIAPEYTDPSIRKDHSTVNLARYTGTLVGSGTRRALLALLAASGVLWLIAIVNVTSLLLARGTARQREIAMRGALGASRARVVQQMMVEGLLLSTIAAALGIGVAVAGMRLAEIARPRSLNLDLSSHLNFPILAALCGLTILSALCSAAWPALLAVCAPIEPALRQGGLHSGAGRRQHRLRGILVAAEIAMSLTLLMVCGLLLRTIYNLRQVPLGFRSDHIIVANLSIPAYRFAGQNLVPALYQPLLERAQHMHGVQSAGLMSEVPLGQTFHITLSLYLNGRTVSAMLKPVTPGIQRIFGFPMLAGRFFNAQDSPTSEAVVVVNPAFAREYAPDKHDPRSILGQTMWRLSKNRPMRIIGILDNERQTSIAQPSQPEVDVCLCQITPDSGIYQPSTIAMDLALRTDRPMNQVIPELRAILKQASPELENASITTMNQIVQDSYGSQRLAAHLLECFGGAALLLCVAGLYGLLAYVVTQRTREIGVRIALGAQRSTLLWMVLRQAGALLLVGVLAGSALALASGRLLRGFLFGVSAHDGWTLAAAAAVLLASGLLAAYLPAHRAAHVNPLEALRSE